MNFRSVVKKLIPKTVFKKVEPFGHLAEAVLFNIFRGFPASKGLKIIGVTGTDGKTTTCMLIGEMLKNSGKKTGVLTTISIDYGDGEGPQPWPKNPKGKAAPGTTASVGLLLDILGKMKRNGVEWVVLETSSHALAQFRVWGIPYSIAVMTNITQEHLDYHGTFKKYLAAKLRLFKHANRNKKGLRTGVINADDPNAEAFSSQIAHPIMYGLNHGDVKASNLRLGPNKSQFVVVVGPDEYNITCNLPGTFNIYNALAAIVVGRVIGLTSTEVEQGIAALEGVPGRMEQVKSNRNFRTVVDYAVTPEALKNSLMAIKASTSGEVHLVFGATGDRDKEKRPVMGKVAAEFADHVYLTDDETYTEFPDDIREAVYKGIDQAGGAHKTVVIEDRREAIKAAFANAKTGDTVLLAGIGHQKERNMGGQKEPWDEREVARRLLA